MVTYDAVVVGGSVAGSVTARELGLRGLRVALLEKARHPRPKACGEGILPHGVAALSAMGLDYPGVRVKGLRYVSPGGIIAEVDFPFGEGMVVRREKFDAYLFDAAAGAPGVEAYPETPYDPDRWKARWVVGADGLHSQFHRKPPFRAKAPSEVRVGLSTHATGLQVDRERVEVIFHEGVEVYLAPSDGEEVLVACLYRQDALPKAPSNELRVLHTLQNLEVLRDRIQGLTLTTPVLGAGPLGLTVSPVATQDTLLVGDAAGATDPVTGEGMSMAMLSARCAAEAIVSGRPGDYEKEHRRLIGGAEWISSWVLRASRHPAIADRVVGSLRNRPELFKKLIEVAIGSRLPAEMTLADLARLVM